MFMEIELVPGWQHGNRVWSAIYSVSFVGKVLVIFMYPAPYHTSRLQHQPRKPPTAVNDSRMQLRFVSLCTTWSWTVNIRGNRGAGMFLSYKLPVEAISKLFFSQCNQSILLVTYHQGQWGIGEDRGVSRSLVNSLSLSVAPEIP